MWLGGDQPGQQGWCPFPGHGQGGVAQSGVEGVTNSMRKSCGDEGKQTHVHGRKERKGGESGMMGRRAQKDTDPLSVVTKSDLGLMHIYKSDNQQKTF